jgi:hypothetical protein
MITYCAGPDEENLRVCRKTVRENYHWDGNAWKQVSQQELPPGP